MATKRPRSNEQVWFRRSLALTLAVGACLLVLLGARPGYGAFFVTSTLAFLVAGLLWSPAEPPRGGLRLRPARRPSLLAGSFPPIRSYRVSTAR